MAGSPISSREVKNHASNDSAWIVINNVVWDVTEFFPKHPGGPEIIQAHLGRDGSDAYNDIHGPGLVANHLGPGKRIGDLDTASLLTDPLEKGSVEKVEEVKADRPKLSGIINVSQFEPVAEAHLSDKTWGYVHGATEDGITNRANAEFYKRIFFRPRILAKVKDVDTSTTILGQKYKLPFFVAPTSSVKQSHTDGELATARASVAYGVAPIIATMSSYSIQEIMDVIPPNHPIFFQLYVYIERAESERLLKQIAKFKPQAILFTVDLPVLSKREAPSRKRSSSSTEAEAAQLAPPPNNTAIDPNINWDDIAYIKKITGAPVFLKGIQTVADARKAYEYGCAGIYLTNHGGRALDTAVPPILTLLEIQAQCPEILEKMEVFIDGGISRGSDILKAICLGASGVLLGRPFLYSLQFGEEGAKRAFASKSYQSHMSWGLS